MVEFKANLELLKKLVYSPGIPGYEDRIRQAIINEVKDLGDLSVDEHGNIILDLGGDGKTLLIAAHMDELGLVITNIFDDGLLSFRKLGGIDDRILPARHVRILGEKGEVYGVINFPSPHLNFEKDQSVIPWHKLRIFIGAESREEAEEMGIYIGAPAVFIKHWTLLAGGKAVASRGFDDRAGTYALVELAKILKDTEKKHRIVIAWTVKEEIGLWGAYALAAKTKADAFIAVDTMACCRPEITGRMKPGRGPALRLIDNAYVANMTMANELKRIAKENNIPLQVATGGGTTDASAFQRLGIQAVALGIPLLNTHTLAETIYPSDIENLVKLLYNVAVKGIKI